MNSGQMISEAELQKITAKYDALLAVSQGLLKEDDRKLLENALFIPVNYMVKPRHLTGELLICHCLSIARIAVEEMGLGINSIVAALLHDAFITQSVSIEDIRKKFGSVIADMVKSYARISDLPTGKVVSSIRHIQEALPGCCG